MTDAKRTPAIEATVTRDGNGLAHGLVLGFANGQMLAINSDQLTDALRYEAMFHGLKQKLVDAAAISRNPDTGRSATVDDKFAAVQEVYQRLLAGEWNKARGDGTGTGGLLFRALSILYPQKDIRAYLDSKTDAEQAALRKAPRIAAEIERIRAASAKAGNVDTDALLGELDDAE